MTSPSVANQKILDLESHVLHGYSHPESTTIATSTSTIEDNSAVSQNGDESSMSLLDSTCQKRRSEKLSWKAEQLNKVGVKASLNMLVEKEGDKSPHSNFNKPKKQTWLTPPVKKSNNNFARSQRNISQQGGMTTLVWNFSKPMPARILKKDKPIEKPAKQCYPSFDPNLSCSSFFGKNDSYCDSPKYQNDHENSCFLGSNIISNNYADSQENRSVAFDDQKEQIDLTFH